MKSKLSKKNILVLVLLLIPVLLIGISNYLFSPASFIHIPAQTFNKENAISLFPEEVPEVLCYEQDESTYYSISRDGHMYIDPPDHKVAAVLISLKEPVQKSHSVSVTYAMSYHPLREENTVVAPLPAGCSEVIINLPAAYFTTIRFDMILFDEPYELRGIYLSETTLETREWVGNYDGLLMVSITCILIIAFWIAGLYTGYLDIYLGRAAKWLNDKVSRIKENPKKLLGHIGLLIAIITLACLAEFVIVRKTPDSTLTGIARTLFYATAGFSVYCVILFKGKPEKQFLSLSLLIGMLFIVLSPPFWYGADQQIRYAWAVEESFARTVSVSRADWILTNCGEGSEVILFKFPPAFNYLPSSSDNAILYTFRKGVDTLSYMGIEFEGVRSLYVRLANMPAGLMIFLGRSLALPPVYILKLGMLGNHLVYTALVYSAIKRLNSGKYILAVIAMFPTAFVISTTYGYDYWLTAFVMLGFAYYFHEVQNPDEKIKLKNIIIMIGAFVLGMGPKAAYFPLMLLMYFMRKGKFKEKRGYTGYLIGVSCAVLFVLGSFALPYLASGGAWVDDFRGGGEVDSGAQTMFILQNPLKYAGILHRFIWGYLIGIHTGLYHNHLQYYVTFFIHLGSSSFEILTWAMLGFVTLTDRNEKDRLTSKIGYKALITFLIMLTFALACTALYITFTTVGADTIEGLQGRYLIPFLFPFFYIVGGFKIRTNIDEPMYSMGVFGIMSLVLLTGVWQKLIPAVAAW